MAFIYRIVNPCGRIYVGSTSQKISSRFNKYKILACKKQVKLYRSLLKYGVENHLFQIIKECTNEEKYGLEAHYGNFYACLDKGLNCVLPSDNKKYSGISEETREKVRQSSIGRFWSAERRKLQSDKMKGKSISEGIPKSEEWKRKMSERSKGHKYNIGRKHSKESIEKRVLKIRKSVIQMNLDGEDIREWNSAREVADFLGVSPCCIRDTISGKQKTSKGFKFRYK